MEIVCVGGGISGLAAVYYLEQALPSGVKITLLESAPRLGGKLNSQVQSGFLVESAANGWLASSQKPLVSELSRALGLESAQLVAAPMANERYIYYQERLQRAPRSVRHFLTTRLLSLRSKLQVCLEPWAPPRTVSEETVAAFVERRLGREVLTNLIGPLCSGIYAGDPEEMSLASSFKRIQQLEDEYGSLLKALVGLTQKRLGAYLRAKSGYIATSPAGYTGTLTTFKEGMGYLPAQIAARLKSQVYLQTEVKQLAVNPVTKRYALTLANTENCLEADIVILATPTFVASKLVKAYAPELALNLDQIVYAPLIVVALGFLESAFKKPPRGYGFLMSLAREVKERYHLLGTLYDSNIFSQRAPAGHFLGRVLLGGARYPELIDLSTQELLALATRELSHILDISSEPVFTEVLKHPAAIPQYTVGHADLVTKIEALLSRQYPGLYLTGNAYSGVSLHDCLRRSKEVAMAIVRRLKGN